MFAYISGKLVYKDPTIAIVDVQGVGYELRISLQSYSALTSEHCKLYAFLHIKEDAHTLYGFIDYDEKKLFLHLISVSGIGPNTALMILSSLSVIEIREAIVNEDVRLLQSIKGIGTKTAQRIILDLKDKIRKEELTESQPNVKNINISLSSNSAKYEALTALVTLGIAKPVAEKSLESILKKYGAELSVEEMIKYALKNN